MKRMLKIILIVLILVSAVPAFSTPATPPPYIYIKNVTMFSDTVKFVECNLSPTGSCSYEETSEIYSFLSQMSIDRKYDNSTFEVVLLNGSQEISMYTGNLSSLRLPDNLGNDTNDSLYKFPLNIDPYFHPNSFEKIDANLIHFDNQTFLLKLNGTVVREYTLGYFPGNLNNKVTFRYAIPSLLNSIDMNFFILIFSFSLFVVVILIFLLVKRRHIKEN